MINGYTIDYLKEMAKQAVACRINDAHDYGRWIAKHYDDVVSVTPIWAIELKLFDDLENDNNLENLETRTL